MNTYLLVYNSLLKAFGRQRWWPVTSENPRLEVCFGAILTQNTSWKNVEKAISNLKENNLISVSGVRKANRAKLAKLIKPAGYYNQKAKKLKGFCSFLIKNAGGKIENLFGFYAVEDVDKLREKLLEIDGVGKETADSMILYAANKPSFVVDAYTRRVFSRLKLISEKDAYDDIRKKFMKTLPHDTDLFNEYHALIVKLGKDFCRKKPLCGSCPIKNFCNR
jgi:endonuclease-3 related protein